MIAQLKRGMRAGFDRVEAALDRAFGPAANPLHRLGALGFFYYWIVAATGVYLYIGFDTSVERAYASVEELTRSPWYLSGVMRSLHRYASDALVAVMLVHAAREFALDRMRGTRWFSWLTGGPVLVLVYASGITGYWMVWDRLAQYIAISTSEWLDWLPIFGEPIARNFLAPGSLSDRFFTLLIFLHIALPLALLFVLWIHLQRINRPKINPPRALAGGSLAAFLALSLWKPALSQGPADLTAVPNEIGLDWFYLALYPLLELWPQGTTWALVAAGGALFAALPWLPPLRRSSAAVVDLDHCNGCGRCVADCPYTAVALVARSDDKPFERQAAVNAGICVSCGICVGACPSSTPFRRAGELVTGIDLPQYALDVLRATTEATAIRLRGADRVIVFGCEHGAARAMPETGNVGIVHLPCVAMLPSSFIDFVVSRRLADGVFVAGCREESCMHRVGVAWMQARIDGTRDPYLRKRVPRERLATMWGAPFERRGLAQEIAAFANRLRDIRPSPPVPGPEYTGAFEKEVAP